MEHAEKPTMNAEINLSAEAANVDERWAEFFRETRRLAAVSRSRNALKVQGLTASAETSVLG